MSDRKRYQGLSASLALPFEQRERREHKRKAAELAALPMQEAAEQAIALSRRPGLAAFGGRVAIIAKHKGIDPEKSIPEAVASLARNRFFQNVDLVSVNYIAENNVSGYDEAYLELSATEAVRAAQAHTSAIVMPKPPVVYPSRLPGELDVNIVQALRADAPNVDHEGAWLSVIAADGVPALGMSPHVADGAVIIPTTTGWRKL